MDYEEAFSFASSFYCTDQIDLDWQSWSEAELDAWLINHVWEPLEGKDFSELYDIIDASAYHIMELYNTGYTNGYDEGVRQ